MEYELIDEKCLNETSELEIRLYSASNEERTQLLDDFNARWAWKYFLHFKVENHQKDHLTLIKASTILTSLEDNIIIRTGFKEINIDHPKINLTDINPALFDNTMVSNNPERKLQDNSNEPIKPAKVNRYRMWGKPVLGAGVCALAFAFCLKKQ